MDMLTGEQIAAAGLADWRKLAQGLHARYRVDDLGAAARFVMAGGTAGDDASSPALTVVADPDGDQAILCTDTSTGAGATQ